MKAKDIRELAVAGIKTVTEEAEDKDGITVGLDGLKLVLLAEIAAQLEEANVLKRAELQAVKFVKFV